VKHCVRQDRPEVASDNTQEQCQKCYQVGSVGRRQGQSSTLDGIELMIVPEPSMHGSRACHDAGGAGISRSDGTERQRNVDASSGRGRKDGY
jgi:hypothetical protein